MDLRFLLGQGFCSSNPILCEMGSSLDSVSVHDGGVGTMAAKKGLSVKEAISAIRDGKAQEVVGKGLGSEAEVTFINEHQSSSESGPHRLGGEADSRFERK